MTATTLCAQSILQRKNTAKQTFYTAKKMAKAITVTTVTAKVEHVNYSFMYLTQKPRLRVKHKRKPSVSLECEGPDQTNRT